MTDVIGGSAGVIMAAVWAGGVPAADIAATGGQALLAAADQTEGGLDWGMVCPPGAARRTLAARPAARWPRSGAAPGAVAGERRCVRARV